MESKEEELYSVRHASDLDICARQAWHLQPQQGALNASRTLRVYMLLGMFINAYTRAWCFWILCFVCYFYLKSTKIELISRE